MVAVAPTNGTAEVRPHRASTAPDTGHGFRPDVQALRALAVGLVVLAHLHMPDLAGGFIGVDVFFVISGFLITGLLAREHERTGRVSILGFYGRRMRRIMPAASLVLVVTVAASYHWLGSITGAKTATDAQWAAGFLANLHFVAIGTTYLGAQDAPSTLQHYWSLAVEEQFYVVWPALFIALAALATKTRSKAYMIMPMVLVAAGSYAYSIIETATNAKAAYFSPLTRGAELAAGAVLALSGPALARMSRGFASLLTVAGLAGIAVVALMFNDATTFPGAAVAVPVLATCAVLAGGAAASTGPLGAAFRFPPIQWLGQWSYSLYLWHWPLITITEQYLNHPLSVMARVLLVVASIVLAALTYWLVENPARNARTLRNRPTLSVLAGIALIIVVVAVSACFRIGGDDTAAGASATWARKGSNSYATIAEVKALVAAAPEITKVPADLVPPVSVAGKDENWVPKGDCFVDVNRTTGKECVYGDPDGAHTVALFGDSHAAMWLKAFDAAGRRDHVKIQLFAKSSCPVPTLHFWLTNFGRKNTECDAYRDWAIQRLNALKPETVVLTSMWMFPRDFDDKYITEDEWATGMRTTFTRLKPSGAKLVVLGDIPYLKQSAPECLAAHMNNVKACARPATEAIRSEHAATDRRTAESAGARYVDVTPWFCASTCQPIIGDMIVYSNQYHITATYSEHLAGAIAEAIGI